MASWKRSKQPGIYYREHPTRRNGPHPDRYLTLRYTSPEGRRQEVLGWVSEGWTVERAAQLLGELKQNIRTGEGPTTLGELRADNLLARKAKEAEADRRSLTFGQVAERYLAWARQSKKTWADDAWRYKRHLEKPLGGRLLTEVTTPVLIDLKADLDRTISRNSKRTLSPATVLQCLALVRQIFNYARETPFDAVASQEPMFTGANPAKLTRRKGYGVRMPVIDNARLRVLTPAEFAQLLAAALPDYPEQHDMILVAYDCGLRRSELLALTAQHVVGEGESLHVVDTKGGRNRVVFPKLSREVLVRRARAATAESPYLFPGRDGSRDGGAFTRVFKRIAARSGLNDGVTDPRFRITPHTLRHTYATMLYMETHDLYLVLRRLGHADFSTTRKYVHLAEELAARMGATFTGQR
jgi:integrase